MQYGTLGRAVWDSEPHAACRPVPPGGAGEPAPAVTAGATCADLQLAIAAQFGRPAASSRTSWRRAPGSGPLSARRPRRWYLSVPGGERILLLDAGLGDGGDPPAEVLAHCRHELADCTLTA